MSRDAIAPTRRIHTQPLTIAAFAPYGEVIEHAGDQRRRYLSAPFEHSAPAATSTFWVSEVTHASNGPVLLEVLERHPWSAQTFIPLTYAGYLVVVAPTLINGLPDLDNLQAFEASPQQGVCYRTGVWHHGLSVLKAPAQFVVTMTVSGGQGDDEFWDVPCPIEVVLSR